MSKLEVSFSVGIVSAFYFIIFDLVLLTIVDLVLSRIANSLYYRRINNGYPLIIRSADVPGITTFLVGRYFSLPNIIGIAIKVFFLLCIVMIERGIDAERSRSFQTHSLSATFNFNPSEKEWGNQYHRIVTRRWERIRLCRESDKNNSNSDSFTFYHIAFNLRSEQQLEDERRETNSKGYIDINDRSIRCLSPSRVVEKDVRPLQQIVGCSQLFPTQDCRNESIIRLPVNQSLPYALVQTRDKPPDLVSIPVGTGFVSLSVVTHYLTELLPLFPQFANTTLYRNPELTCARTRMGPSLSNSKMYRTCLLIVQYQGNNTLVERWSHDLKTDSLIRHFPGPIFKGNIEFAIRQRANHLVNLVFGFNWESFAGTLVADAVVYRKVDWTFETFENRMVTTVPVYAMVLGISLLFIAIVARVVVIFTIGRDLRPQLNQIDGLSSVAREELAPSGRSMVTGRSVLLGLSHRGWGKHLHFGPLLTYRECARRSDGELVE